MTRFIRETLPAFNLPDMLALLSIALFCGLLILGAGIGSGSI